MEIAGQEQAGAARRIGGLLRQRDFRLLWTGETVSAAGNAMAVVGMPLLAVTALHASTFAVAALTAAAYLPWLVIGLPAGAWVDRLPTRPVMIACDLASAILYASLPVAAWRHVLTTGLLIVVASLAGAANVLFTTAYHVYLPSLVTTADLIEGNAKLQGSASVAAISGRGAAGLAAEAMGAATAMLFNAGSFLVSAGCLLSIRAAAPAPEPATGWRTGRKQATTLRAEIAEGIRFLARDPYLRPISIYATTSNLAYAGSAALVVVFLVRIAGFGPAAVGLLMAAAGTGGFLGALVARRLAGRFGTARVLLVSSLGGGLFELLIPLTGTGARAACYVFGAGISAATILIGNIIVGSFRQAYAPPAMLGRVTAAGRFLGFGGIPFGALAAGGLGTAIGVRNALWVMLGIDALTATFLLTRAIRSNENLPARHAA